ncbi:MAG TPA: hypothetical protein VJ044_03995 [Candidatus Hodarchaeales archaeon]|nr:hypothetical protein [Candidatus Hodarchaeales archaeon]
MHEWNIGRKVPEGRFLDWIISKIAEVRADSTPLGKAPSGRSTGGTEPIITVVYQDNTGERKYIGEASQRALDAGLFQAIRPGEIIRQFGIALKSMEFAITDASFPSWVWLNHETGGSPSQGSSVQESSIFAILEKEPNIRNLDAIHSLIHRILEGKERRQHSSDDIVRDPVFKMLREVLILEKSSATRMFESDGLFASSDSLQTTNFEPFFLMNFKLAKQRLKLSWDTMEVWAKGKLTKETFSTGGYPWILDSTNRFKDVLMDLFSRRLQGEVFMKKASFRYEGRTYYTISDVIPDSLRARIIVFRSDEKGSLNYVDIRRRFDLFISQSPEKFGFRQIVPEMNAADTQLVIDRLALEK